VKYTFLDKKDVEYQSEDELQFFLDYESSD